VKTQFSCNSGINTGAYLFTFSYMYYRIMFSSNNQSYHTRGACAKICGNQKYLHLVCQFNYWLSSSLHKSLAVIKSIAEISYFVFHGIFGRFLYIQNFPRDVLFCNCVGCFTSLLSSRFSFH